MVRAATEIGEVASSRRGSAGPAGAAPAPSSGRVLVVEDEQDVAELIRYNLAKEGYDVRLAASGVEGLKQVKESRPDVILLDIMVPQLNGWEVCRRLKQAPETRGIPVIMVRRPPAEAGEAVETVEAALDWLAGSAFLELKMV